MADTDTGGGASVGGKAQAGGDLSGRDSTSVGDSSAGGNLAARDYHQAEFGDNATGAAVGRGNRVDIYNNQRSNDTDRDLLLEMARALGGHPFNASEPGLVSLVAGMSKTLDGVVKFQDDATKERRVLTERIDATDGEVFHIREALMWYAAGLGVVSLLVGVIYLIVLGVIPIS